jgi:hypothetical protein
MELSPKNFEFFEKKTPNIFEKLIREQGDDTCQQKIGVDYITSKLKEYDFGFIRASAKAQMGQRKTRKTTHQMYSFVLCKLLPNALFKNVDIVLVCSRPTSKDGKQLLELVETKAKDMRYQCLTLIAVGNTRLLHWYESQGFVMETSKPIIDSDSYAYYMRKIIV